MTVRERVLATLAGEQPDRPAYLDRLELWYKSHSRAGTVPAAYAGMTLDEVHRATGMGRQKFVVPYSLRLRGVEVVARLNGEINYHETDPVIENFPGMWDCVAGDRPGVTVTELITPRGTLTLQHELLPDTIAMGADPYLRRHLIGDEADYRAVEYILERAVFVPQYEKWAAEEERISGHGFVVPLLHRIPFQQVLLEYLGEVGLSYALYDEPAQVERLLQLVDEQLAEILRRLGDFPAPYVEFPDNLHGGMTNPRLFARYCLPAFQRHTAALHAQGKKAGSHTDGNVKPLLGLLRESGLDVCESVSPYPLTPCTLDEAWEAWRGGPLIWGGISSPILEERTSEADFCAYVDHVLDLAGAGPMILGIGDLVLHNNSIERVRYIAERVEASVPSWNGPAAANGSWDSRVAIPGAESLGQIGSAG